MRRNGRPGSGAPHAVLLVPALVLGFASLVAHAGDMARGDASWTNRAAGEREGRPQPGPILEAVRSYEGALAADPGNLESRWKLLRALHFAAEFAPLPEQRAREIAERAVDVSEAGLEGLAERLGAGISPAESEPEALRSWLEASDVPKTDVGRLYFWSAISWGTWSRKVGLLEAVLEGVGERLFRYTRIAIDLEPDYEEGGALRLLGRLHAELPRVPWVTGWVDREKAIPLIERAHALAPANPGNRLLLALTLLDLAPARRGEALALLDQVSRLTPRPSMRIEDLAMRKEARERLRAVPEAPLST